MADSHRSTPTLAVCHSASGITLAGTPWALPSCAARPSSSTSCCPRSWLCSSSTGRLAAGLGIGGQQRLELHALLAGARIGVGQRAGGTDGGAGAAAHAQVGIDLDLLARLLAADRLGRTDLDAGVAAHGFVAAVGAELLLVDEELGLLELAHHLAQLEQRAPGPGRPSGSSPAAAHAGQMPARRAGPAPGRTARWRPRSRG